MILRVLSLHDHVFVGITNPDPTTWRSTETAPHRGADTSNPFTYWERSQMVTAALTAEGVESSAYTTVPFPIHDPERWLSYIPQDATQHVRVFGQWEQDKVELLETHYTVRAWTGEDRMAEGTTIRRALDAGEPVDAFINPSTIDLVDHSRSTRRASPSD